MTGLASASATTVPPDAAPIGAIRLSAQARSRMSAWLDLLAKWNRVYNLTAIRDRARMDVLHAQDALTVLPWLPQRPGVRLLDVGSGGGIPGVPLAIARPDWDVALLDANGKKTSFLTQVAIDLALGNVRTATCRIEDYTADAPFDVVISRAFADLATFARAAMNHVAKDGILVAMKGTLPDDEIAALPDEVVVAALPALEVPGLSAARHLVVMRRRTER